MTAEQKTYEDVWALEEGEVRKPGIPQVVAPGGVNLTSQRKSRYKPEHHERRKFDLDELRTFLRVSDEEMEQISKVFAEKLNAATGPMGWRMTNSRWSREWPSTTRP